MARSLLLLPLVLLACEEPPSGPSGLRGKVGTTPGDPGQQYTGPRPERDRVRIETSGPIACARPELRDTAHFRRLQSAALPTSLKHLWGAGIVAADFTGDGEPDLFQVGESSSTFWVTAPDVDPEAVQILQTHPAWLDAADLDFGVGGIPADLDGDGWLDLVVTRWERPNRILRNLGGTGFEDVTPPAMEAYSWRTQSATAGDIDGDGDLDLIFGNYAVDPEDGFDVYMPPAEPAELYRNDGSGQWTDLSDRLPAEIHDGYTFATGLYDLDGDRLPELIVSNDFGKERPSVLAANRGDFLFEPDLSWHPDVEDMGLGVADLNHDEVPDFLITSWRTISLLISGEATGVPGTWFSAADAAGIAVEHETQTKRQDFGWGVELADIDNDGDPDALAMFGDWEVWTSDLNELDALWINNGDSTFEERAADPEWDLADDKDGRALVTVDLNGDGYLDVVKRNVNQLSRLHLSHCGELAWLRVELAWDGPNSRGIGAKVRVISNNGSQIRWITSGSTGLYTGQPPEAHFGLGTLDAIDALQIEWPDGLISEFQGLQTRQRIRVVRDHSSM